MTEMKKILSLAASCAVVFSSMAEGYQVNTLSSKQEGMGHVGVAMKLGAESMIFNPAGLGFSDRTLDLSGSLTAIKPTAKATTNGITYKTANEVSTPIGIGASFRIYDNLQAGISFYTPYGSAINWGENWPGAVLNQKVNLATYTVQPTVGWRILPKLSVGAGLMVTWGSVDLNKGLVSAASTDALLGRLAASGVSAAMGLDPDYRFGMLTPASVNLNGTSSIALGFNVGIMYDIIDNVTVGFSYRSKMKMKVDAGMASVSYANDIARVLLQERLNVINSTNFSAEMPCPEVACVGVSYRPSEKLVLAFDAQLTGWSTYKHLDIEFDQLDAYNQHLVKDYKDAWTFHLGAQYALTERFDARLGLMVDTTPVNENHYNPETPGMTKIEPTIGFSFRPVKGFSIDVAFMYVAGLGKDNASCKYADLLSPLAGTPAEGEFSADYKVSAVAPSIGFSYSF